MPLRSRAAAITGATVGVDSAATWKFLRTADGGDVMRQMLGFMLQAFVDAEATSVIGAAPHERSDERTTHRNGTRPKTVSTTAGDLTVKIPQAPGRVVLPHAA